MQNNMELGHSDLQYGLIRWVQNYGEHILKTLIARSPKLPHPRRLPHNVPMPPQNGNPMVGMPRPRLSRQDSGGKGLHFEGGTMGGGMLHPSYQHRPFLQHGLHLGGTSPTTAFYNVLPQNPSQLSPPNVSSSSAVNAQVSGGEGGGGNGNFQRGLLVRMPPGLAQTNPQSGLGQGMVVMPPIPMAPLSVHPPSHQAVPLTQPSSPVLLHSQNSVAKTDDMGGGGGGGGGVEMGHYQPPQTQSLMSTLNPLMATSAHPSSCSPGHLVHQPGTMGGAGRVSGPGQYHSMLGSTHSLPPSSNQFLPSLPPSSSNNLLTHITPSNPPPPPPPQNMAGPHSVPANAKILGGELEPLLPNPPLPSTATFHPLVPSMHTPPPPPHGLAPHVHQSHQPGSFPGGLGIVPMPQQQLQQPQNPVSLSPRSEVVCRHFTRGMCPFGEKCWFAHPLMPMAGLDGHNGQVPPVQGLGASSNPNVQMCPPPFWLNNPPMDYTALTSPPQSPINPAMMPRPPMAPGSMFRPHSCMAYPNQQPFMFFRGGLMGNPRNAGSNLAMLPASPIPMPSNPHLNFFLLSRVILQSGEGVGPVQAVSQLATYADQFFVTFESLLVTYKIIFGGNRNCQVSILCIAV